MCDNGCSRCSSLEARIAKLEKEVAALINQIAEIKRYVNVALGILQPLIASLRSFLVSTKKAMAQGGIPRGEWSYKKGARSIAKPVYKQLLTVNRYLQAALGG